jgi:hypothetical protein
LSVPGPSVWLIGPSCRDRGAEVTRSIEVWATEESALEGER